MLAIVIIAIILCSIIYVFAFKRMGENNNNPNRVKTVRMLLKIMGVIVILIVVVSVWAEQSRSFYCLSERKCITVWKRSGNICYIIPGKYSGIFKPSDNYIKTTNVNPLVGNNYFTFYFTEEMPNTLIYRSKSTFEVYNGDKQKLLLIDYDSDVEKYKEVLYIPDAKKVNDLKENVNLISLDTKENYATDKSGKKLK